MLAPDSDGTMEEAVFSRVVVAFFPLHLIHASDLCLFPKRNMVFALLLNGDPSYPRQLSNLLTSNWDYVHNFCGAQSYQQVSVIVPRNSSSVHPLSSPAPLSATSPPELSLGFCPACWPLALSMPSYCHLIFGERIQVGGQTVREKESQATSKPSMDPTSLRS